MPRMPLPPFRPRGKTRSAAVCLFVAAAAAVCGGALPKSAHAQSVTALYTSGGGFFNYNFTVRNTTAFTLADVSISLPTNAIATNLSAPTGFQITFDSGGNGPGMGIVDFLADASPSTPQDFFAGTTTSGFLLRSATQLNGATFNTLDENGNSSTGTVSATANPAAPEPGSLALLSFGAVPAASAFFASRRRRRCFAAPVSLKG